MKVGALPSRGSAHPCLERCVSPVRVRHVRRDWPFYWISTVNSLYTQAMERRLKPFGLDVPRWRVLISLYEETAAPPAGSPAELVPPLKS